MGVTFKEREKLAYNVYEWVFRCQNNNEREIIFLKSMDNLRGLAMSKEFEDLQGVAENIGDGGSFNPDTKYKTTGELVDALVDLGGTDKVHAFHDDYLGLKDRLSDDFLNLPLDTLDPNKFESEIEDVLEEANIIIPLANKELTDDDVEQIKDDMIYSGKDPDDMDI